MWEMELQRQGGSFDGGRHQMTKEFIKRITYPCFLEEAQDTFALMELANFYENLL